MFKIIFNREGFPERLRRLREEKGLLQRELAEKLNLSRVAITHYEQGKRFPEWGTLQKMADLFNVSVDYLLGRTEHRHNHTSNAKDKTETIATHKTDDPMSELPDEAKKALEEFKEFILRKYGKGKE
ncbi:helix-turn-helix domain-containing protein [Thermoanaerobacterium butyriciformans]|uniref:Transcriptional regulator with XRE-family HTH domain n=1 Tax=Thermoanaerobacterium butyriciformans TaxID=1702242 RepID=A0ABS4NF42_9THEO|nr:transcriptional regulator with XRE-family HTH domain [Thermoanaerobacterium butyriciformans]